MAKQIEGTWEEIAAHAPELAGHRVRLAILEDEAELVHIPGLVPGRMHGKPFKEWKAFLDALPVFSTRRILKPLSEQLLRTEP